MEAFQPLSAPQPATPRPARRPNRMPFYLLGGFLIFFGLFVWLLTGSSPMDEASKAISQAGSIADVRTAWETSRSTIGSDTSFDRRARQRLLALNPSPTEIAAIIQWLPRPRALNLIVVPDLSNRLNPSMHPTQAHDDTVILHHLWREFVQQAKSPAYSADKMVMELSNEEQLGEGFREVANNLITDMASPNRPVKLSNRLYLKRLAATTRYKNNISQVYAQAVAKAAAGTLSGADFRRYVNEKLPRLIKPSSLAQENRNVLVIITDGYLETSPHDGQPGDAFTGDNWELKIIGQRRNTGTDWEQAVAPPIIHKKIPPCEVDLSNVDVLILQVEERSSGRGRDFDILQHYWKDWFNTMHARNIKFMRREEGTDMTKTAISQYIRQAPAPQLVVQQ